MNNLQVLITTVILSLCVALFTDGASLPDVHLRSKRQTADVRTTEYLARLALGRGLNSYGCKNIACGIVDIYRSGKKRAYSRKTDEQDDVKEYLLRSLMQQSDTQ